MNDRDKIRFDKYLEKVSEFLNNYKGQMPFAVFLKDCFRNNPQMGGRDRREVSKLCWQLFRIGHWKKELPLKQRLIMAARQRPEENGDLLETLDLSGEAFSSPDPVEIFPFIGSLSAKVEPAAYVESFKKQPDLFLRLRPGKEDAIQQKLSNAGIGFAIENAHCLRLPNLSAADRILDLDREAVVQDLNSQHTGTIVAEYVHRFLSDQKIHLWDCCAGSGGKTILLHDLLSPASIVVSDSRYGILQNLKQRIRQAGVPVNDLQQLDLSKRVPAKILPGFNVIFADMPCSGSGTWARTPEEMAFFTEKKIMQYAGLQLRIAKNTLPFLAPGGLFVYVTCSVFAAENELNFHEIIHRSGMQQLEMKLLEGYNNSSDSLFIGIARHGTS